MGEARRKREKQVNPSVTTALETVAGRIIRRLQSDFGPVLSGRVKIAKQQPQLGGKVAQTIVEAFF
jgi:dihydroneopterin aldolase